MSGHLLALVAIIPFSTLKLSTGKPAIFHALIVTGSPRVLTSENCFEQGIPDLMQTTFHSFMRTCLGKLMYSVFASL